MTRIGISTRVFGLSAALGLAASDRVVPQVAGAFLLVCAIAALACLPQPTEMARRLVPIIEGSLVGLALASGGLVSEPLGLYLLVPVLMGGLVGGTAIAALTLLAESATMSAVIFVSEPAGMVPTRLSDVLPWLLTGVGIGLLGAHFGRVRLQTTDVENAGYVEARRLLDGLRVVSRRLSSGLDSERQATTILNDCLSLIGRGTGAVLVRPEDDGFICLTQRSSGPTMHSNKDPLVLRCWESGEAMHVGADSMASSASHRSIFPIRQGTRMVGVLVIHLPRRLEAQVLQQIEALLDERALRLEAALLFDEVRTHATVEERRRVAREIHDGVAQEIASLAYLVDDLATVPDEVRAERVSRLRIELTRIVDDLRLSIFDLRSQVSQTTGLGAALADYLRQVDLRSDITVHLSLDESAGRLALDVEEQLLRIVQEAVTNARKHSGAENLWVSCVVRAPAAVVVVEDDGTGMTNPAQAKGFGLSVMRERAQHIGAMLSLDPQGDRGTRVAVVLPPPSDGNALPGDGAWRAVEDWLAVTSKKAVSHV